MKLSITAIAAFIALSAAQLNLPSCAYTCVTRFSSGGNIGTCNANDIACICGNAGFLDAIACCLTEVCSVADQQQATSEAIKFCRVTGGVTGLPTAVSCATASVTSSAASTASSAASTTGSGSSAAPATTSAASTTSSAAAQTSASATGSGTAAATSRNAGVQNVAGVGAGVLGAFAAILL